MRGGARKVSEYPKDEFEVVVIFDRKNPKTGILEKNMERRGTLYAKDQAEAKALYLEQFTENEPTRRRIHSVKVFAKLKK